jgi:parvulin-like peptidyl-prolyl isomerase
VYVRSFPDSGRKWRKSTSKLGGELPAFTRGVMAAEFETVAFGLPVGGISEPFKTEFGYHIVRVTDHQPMPFERCEPLWKTFVRGNEE